MYVLQAYHVVRNQVLSGHESATERVQLKGLTEKLQFVSKRDCCACEGNFPILYAKG